VIAAISSFKLTCSLTRFIWQLAKRSFFRKKERKSIDCFGDLRFRWPFVAGDGVTWWAGFRTRHSRAPAAAWRRLPGDGFPVPIRRCTSVPTQTLHTQWRHFSQSLGGLTFPTLLPLRVPVTMMCDMQYYLPLWLQYRLPF